MTVAGVFGRQPLFLVRIHRSLATGLMEMPNRSGRWMSGALGHAFPCMDQQGKPGRRDDQHPEEGFVGPEQKSGGNAPGDIPAARPPGADRSQVNASVQFSIC